jgi:hypothetical protein
MKTLTPLFATVLVCACLITDSSVATTINFDDVVGDEVDITTRYSSLGVTLNAIPNPFPLNGPFPAPANLPPILAGVTTYYNFPSGGFNQVAVSALTYGNNQPGNAGILISFAFDVSHVSLLGVDAGGIGFEDDESVTLTAYDLAGNRIGQTFSQINLGTTLDETPAAIDLPNMRYVAFNYTDTLYGFYAIDNLEFTPVPEPSTVVLLGFGVLVGIGASISKRTMTRPLGKIGTATV